jgi:hypothetical protein
MGVELAVEGAWQSVRHSEQIATFSALSQHVVDGPRIDSQALGNLLGLLSAGEKAVKLVRVDAPLPPTRATRGRDTPIREKPKQVALEHAVQRDCLPQENVDAVPMPVEVRPAPLARGGRSGLDIRPSCLEANLGCGNPGAMVAHKAVDGSPVRVEVQLHQHVRLFPLHPFDHEAQARRVHWEGGCPLRAPEGAPGTSMAVLPGLRLGDGHVLAKLRLIRVLKQEPVSSARH